MTITQFDQMRFGADMYVRYHGTDKVYPIVSVDFQEKLIGIDETGNEDDPIGWKRCENCTMVPDSSDLRTVFAS